MKVKQIKKPILSFIVIIIIITMVVPVLAIDIGANEVNILLENSNIMTENNILDINETIIPETEYNNLKKETNVTDLENEVIVEKETNVTEHKVKNNFITPVPLVNIPLIGSTSDDLQAAVDNATSGDTIIVSSDITYTTTSPSIIIPADKVITIQSDTGNKWTLSQSRSSIRHFTVNGTLNLQDIILEGGNKGGGITVNSGATFNMNNNTTIQNCYNYDGGAVMNSGIFNMYEAIITKCSGGNTGGVRCAANGQFNIYGGTISENSALISGGLIINYLR